MTDHSKYVGFFARAGVEILNIVGFCALFVAIASFIPALARAEITRAVLIEFAVGGIGGIAAILGATYIKRKLQAHREETILPPAPPALPTDQSTKK